MSSDDARIIVRSFVRDLVDALGSKKSLGINIVEGASPILPEAAETISDADCIAADQSIEKYDLVLADLPLGLNREPIRIDGVQLNVRRNWAMLYKALHYLAEDGLCLALIEPSGFSVAEGPKFEERVNREGFFVRGLFSTPGETLPKTGLRPVLAAIDRREQTAVFAGEIDEVSHARQLARRFASEDPGTSLRQGVLVEPGAFRGFDSLRADQQLARLETQYKEYDSIRLGELAREVITVRSGEQHVDKDNTIYIPMVGTSATTHDLNEVTVKHHNVFQVVLTDDAESEYVAAFFRSDLGLLILRSLTMGAVIPKIRKSACLILII